MKASRLLTVAILMALAPALPGAGQEQGGFGEGELAPIGIPPDFGEHMALMYDMLFLAFQTDSTRVASLLLAHDGSNLWILASILGITSRSQTYCSLINQSCRLSMLQGIRICVCVCVCVCLCACAHARVFACTQARVRGRSGGTERLDAS